MKLKSDVATCHQNCYAILPPVRLRRSTWGYVNLLHFEHVRRSITGNGENWEIEILDGIAKQWRTS